MSKDLPTSVRSAFFDSVDCFDQKADALFDPLRDNVLANQVFYSASALADHSILWFIIALTLYLVKPSWRKQSLVAAFILLAESGVVNVIVKTLFNRERPLHEGERPLPLRQPLTSSFPSGHATAATCAAILFQEVRFLKWPVRLAAALVITSRIHVKIHHASDVIAGIAFGWLFARASKKTVSRFFGV